jgi:hypothetical protein
MMVLQLPAVPYAIPGTYPATQIGVSHSHDDDVTVTSMGCDQQWATQSRWHQAVGLPDGPSDRLVGSAGLGACQSLEPLVIVAVLFPHIICAACF